MLQREAGGCDLQFLAELLPLLGLTVDGKTRGKPLHLGAHLKMDRRANGLTDEYAQKARETDWNYCGIARPPRVPLPGVVQPVRQIGPVETKLLS